MKRMIGIITGFILIGAAAFSAAEPYLAEMALTESWRDVPDSPDIQLLWHSDESALLALTEAGAGILDKAGVQVERLDRMESDREYYIVSSRTGSIPDGLAGNPLKTGDFLAGVPRGTLIPAGRDIGLQRVQAKNRPLSRLEPRAYHGYASKDYDPFIQSYVDEVQSADLLDILTNLVGFQTRYSTTQGCVNATNWAASQFESWGYTTELFPHTAGMAPNVIAWKTGMINPDSIWVVGGHVDSISDNNPSVFAPGADDNGTGSALTLCCAELLKDLNFADTIIFALWTGEEQGLYGSDAWAEWAADENLNILGYYNFDMIGWVDPSPEDLDVLVNAASQSFGQDFVDVADLYTNLLHHLEVANVTASDHYSFWQEGYVAFCAIEDYWPTYPYYHTDQDTIDKVNFPFFTEVTKAMVANICTAAQPAETIAIVQPAVRCEGSMNLMVIDFDSSGSIVVHVASTTEPSPEMVLLTETGNHLFEGSIPLTSASPTTGDGVLSVSHGDTITATFSGVSNTATTSVDCQTPTISSVFITSVTSQSATVTFTTNEPTSAIIRYGIGTPGTETPATAPATTHSIQLDGLDDCTHYVFEVQATDTAGNMTIDSNGGTYFSFTTMERITVLLETMDTDPGWIYEGEWAWGQPSGGGGQYGNPDPTGGFTGNNVIGYNLAGDYPNNMSSTLYATTHTIDCSTTDIVILSFYAWLGIEQDEYDHASIDVSNTNGSTWATVWENTGTLEGGAWDRWELDISAQAAGSSQVKIRWGMGPTDSAWRYCGWNIDDVELFAELPCAQPTATPTECIHHGDVNFSGDVTAGDAQLTFQIALGSYSPSYTEACAADCNGDSQVTAGDAQQVFLMALGSGGCADPL